MTDSLEYVSCLVRIWHNQAQKYPETTSTLQIQVENIQSGGKCRFDTLEDLFRYFESQITLSGSHGSSSHQNE